MCTQIKVTWLFGNGGNPKCLQSFPKSGYIMTISFEKIQKQVLVNSLVHWNSMACNWSNRRIMRLTTNVNQEKSDYIQLSTKKAHI